jgi:hypothetical protein
LVVRSPQNKHTRVPCPRCRPLLLARQPPTSLFWHHNARRTLAALFTLCQFQTKHADTLPKQDSAGAAAPLEGRTARRYQTNEEVWVIVSCLCPDFGLLATCVLCRPACCGLAAATSAKPTKTFACRKQRRLSFCACTAPPHSPALFKHKGSQKIAKHNVC